MLNDFYSVSKNVQNQKIDIWLLWFIQYLLDNNKPLHQIYATGAAINIVL